jgi:hypothetical protein
MDDPTEQEIVDWIVEKGGLSALVSGVHGSTTRSGV